MWYWLSSNRMTVGVEVDEDDIIEDTPPIVRKFRGQPLANLARWMGWQGGFRMQKLS
jgi:hypothetical protein